MLHPYGHPRRLASLGRNDRLGRGYGRPSGTMHRPSTRWIALVVLLGTAGCAAEIPHPEDLQGDDITKRAKGQALLRRAVGVHGGRDAWLALGDLRFTMVDAWEPAARLSSPYPVPSPVRVDYAYNFDLDKGRMVFADRPEIVWGHDSVEGWVQRGGVRVYDDVDEATFVVPTEAYFFSLPFKLMDDAALVYYAGKREHLGKQMETVLVTFPPSVGTVQDRYLAHFDPDTGLLAYLRSTVEDMASFIEIDADYSDWQSVEGLMMPGRIEIALTRPLPMEFHTLTFTDIRPDPDFDRTLYEKPRGGSPHP